MPAAAGDRAPNEAVWLLWEGQAAALLSCACSLVFTQCQETHQQPSLCCCHLAGNQEGFPPWIKAAPQQLLCRIVLNSAKKTFWGGFFLEHAFVLKQC